MTQHVSDRPAAGLAVVLDVTTRGGVDLVVGTIVLVVGLCVRAGPVWARTC